MVSGRLVALRGIVAGGGVSGSWPATSADLWDSGSLV